MLERENKALAECLVKLTDERHAKYGDSPSIWNRASSCPGDCAMSCIGLNSEAEGCGT